MPRINRGPELSAEDKITRLKDFPEDFALVKEIVCPFFKSGKNPGCRNCMQPDDTLSDCRDEYVDIIERYPAAIKWEAVQRKRTPREKVKIDEIVEIGLGCDSCYVSDNCPLFQAGEICGIDWGDENVGHLSPKEIYDRMIDLQFKRVNRAAKFEEVDGGTPSDNTSNEMDRLTSMVNMKADLDTFKIKTTSEFKGPAQPGILSQLFGGGNKQLTPQSTEFQPVEIMPNTESTGIRVELPAQNKHKKNNTARKK